MLKFIIICIAVMFIFALIGEFIEDEKKRRIINICLISVIVIFVGYRLFFRTPYIIEESFHDCATVITDRNGGFIDLKMCSSCKEELRNIPKEVLEHLSKQP